MCNAEKLAAYLDGCVRGEFSYDAGKDAFVYTRDRFVYTCPVSKAGVACDGRFLITSKMLAWVVTTNLIKDNDFNDRIWPPILNKIRVAFSEQMQ